MTLTANVIRMLAADGVQKANSGHPGLPMGMADAALVLWTKFLRYNPQDPEWPNRDRFVLSAGHGSMLLYTMLHLAGYDVTIDDLKSFRQWGSRTPGHPEHGMLPGVETTTGPLGQGFGNGIGMAIAAKMTAARYGTEAKELLASHFIYAIVSDGDLMEGVASEAASLAGHLRLGNLIYLYDSNRITIEGTTNLTFSEDVARRFEAYGWQTLTVDGHERAEVEAAIEAGRAETTRPTLIVTRTHIGFGSPKKQDTSEAHGAPLGKEEIKATKRGFGLPEDQDFFVPPEVTQLFAARGEELKREYRDWQTRFAAWRTSHPEEARRWDAAHSGTIDEAILEEIRAVAPTGAAATRAHSGKVMQRIAELLPEFVGGSADLHPSTSTYMAAYPAVAPDAFEGRNFHFGIREHGMGSVLNGMALYGGFVPFGSTFFVFTDYMRPPVRLASIMHLGVIYVFTHDSIFVGEDGPTHQPIEHLAALRAIPEIVVLRPADGSETALAWTSALARRHGPTALILTRQKLEPIERATPLTAQAFAQGGYVAVKESGSRVDLTLVATGSEVQVAIAARKLLEPALSVRVVSMPGRELYAAQPAAVRNDIVPAGAPVVVVEAGIQQGWGDVFRQPMLFLGMNRFGASAPNEALAEHFGFTGPAVATKVRAWLPTAVATGTR
ncbi:MAG TPA: transketolase [Polyangia bacterium]|nr:transketolase [Polyangia bacterium]